LFETRNLEEYGIVNRQGPSILKPSELVSLSSVRRWM